MERRQMLTRLWRLLVPRKADLFAQDPAPGIPAGVSRVRVPMTLQAYICPAHAHATVDLHTAMAETHVEHMCDAMASCPAFVVTDVLAI